MSYNPHKTPTHTPKMPKQSATFICSGCGLNNAPAPKAVRKPTLYNLYAKQVLLNNPEIRALSNKERFQAVGNLWALEPSNPKVIQAANANDVNHAAAMAAQDAAQAPEAMTE
jgi:hypothetical protein